MLKGSNCITHDGLICVIFEETSLGEDFDIRLATNIHHAIYLAE